VEILIIMIKKYFAGLIILTSILMSIPAFATEGNTTSSISGRTQEERIQEAQRKLEERFQEAKLKLQEKLTSLQTKQVNQAAATACVGLAVNTREAYIAAAFSTYSTTQASILSVRANSLSAAWSAPSSTQKQLRLAVDKAWSTYRTSHKLAVASHNASTTAAWSTFKTASKNCKASLSGVTVDTRSYGQDMAQ
jgi:hypothetical protein